MTASTVLAKDESLLDTVQQALVTGRGIMGQDPKNHLASHAILARLRRATAFTLDNSFLDVATHASMGTPQEVLSLWQDARPPMPELWIEFDEQRRGKIQADLTPKTRPEPLIGRTGFLVTQSSVDPDTIHVDVLFETMGPSTSFPDAKVGISTCALVVRTSGPIVNSTRREDRIHPLLETYGDTLRIDPEILFQTLAETAGADGNSFEDIKGAHVWMVETFPKRFLSALTLGRGWLTREHWSGPDMEIIHQLVDRVVIVPSQLPRIYNQRILKQNTPKGMDTKSWMYSQTVVSIESDPRLLVAILGLLQRHTYEGTARARERTTRYARGKTIPYLEQHTLRILAPREVVVSPTIVPRGTLDRHVRRHGVVGHWMYRLSERAAGLACPSHDWTHPVDDYDRQTCRHCGWHRWWRRHHERGDAKVGYVTKNYEVLAP